MSPMAFLLPPHDAIGERLRTDPRFPFATGPFGWCFVRRTRRNWPAHRARRWRGGSALRPGAMPYGEHGAGRQTHDLLGRAAQQDVLEPGAAVRAHDDEVGLARLRRPDDCLGWVAG